MKQLAFKYKALRFITSNWNFEDCADEIIGMTMQVMAIMRGLA